MTATINSITPAALAKILTPAVSAGRAAGATRGVLVSPGPQDGLVSGRATDLETEIEIVTEGGIDSETLIGADAFTPADFIGPACPTFTESDCFIGMSYRDLRDIATRVAVAADDTSSRYALQGVHIDADEIDGGTVDAVATDGRRLHWARINPAIVTGSIRCVLPLPALVIFDRVLRSAAREVYGLSGNRLESALWAGQVTVTIVGLTAVVRWAGPEHLPVLHVTATARLVEGRFPAWREVLPGAANGTPAEAATVDLPGDAARGLRDCVKLHKAAEKAGKAAHNEQHRGVRSCLVPVYHHPRGITVTEAGATARGCDWGSDAVRSPAATILDPQFLADGIAAVSRGGSTVALHAIDGQKAVTLTAADGDQRDGAAVTVVIMPLAE